MRGVYSGKEHVGVEVESAAATWSPSPAPRTDRTIWCHHVEIRLVGCKEPRVEVGELLAARRANSGVDARELLAGMVASS